MPIKLLHESEGHIITVRCHPCLPLWCEVGCQWACPFVCNQAGQQPAEHACYLPFRLHSPVK